MSTSDPRATYTRPKATPTDEFFPLRTATSSAHLVRASGARRESDEAPDVTRDWFDSDEDYERWVAEGSQRFFEVI